MDQIEQEEKLDQIDLKKCFKFLELGQNLIQFILKQAHRQQHFPLQLKKETPYQI